MAKRRTRKTAPIRKHEVKAELSNFELAKAGSSLYLQIFFAGEKIGQMEVGRGSLFWTGRSRQRSKRIDWQSFTRMMDQLAYDTR